mmetsp:Transcript_21540/g.50693  ORF Transcript_21540/g.50693 Transcript_21540/m.50693 type:complete len:226 (+) Transcript_21540:108-785(+)
MTTPDSDPVPPDIEPHRCRNLGLRPSLDGTLLVALTHESFRDLNPFTDLVAASIICGLERVFDPDEPCAWTDVPGSVVVVSAVAAPDETFLASTVQGEDRLVNCVLLEEGQHPESKIGTFYKYLGFDDLATFDTDLHDAMERLVELLHASAADTFTVLFTIAPGLGFDMPESCMSVVKAARNFNLKPHEQITLEPFHTDCVVLVCKGSKVTLTPLQPMVKAATTG